MDSSLSGAHNHPHGYSGGSHFHDFFPAGVQNGEHEHLKDVGGKHSHMYFPELFSEGEYIEGWHDNTGQGYHDHVQERELYKKHLEGIEYVNNLMEKEGTIKEAFAVLITQKEQNDLPDNAFLWTSDDYKEGKSDNKNTGRKLPYKKDGKVDSKLLMAAWKAIHGARGGVDFSGGSSKKEILEEIIPLMKKFHPDTPIITEERSESNMTDKEFAEALAKMKELEGKVNEMETSLEEKNLKIAEMEALVKARNTDNDKLAVELEEIKTEKARIEKETSRKEEMKDIIAKFPIERQKKIIAKLGDMEDEEYKEYKETLADVLKIQSVPNIENTGNDNVNSLRSALSQLSNKLMGSRKVKDETITTNEILASLKSKMK